MEPISLGITLVFGIILMPVIILVLASILGKPHNFRVTGIFLGLFAAILLMMIVAIWVLTTILGFIMP